MDILSFSFKCWKLFIKNGFNTRSLYYKKDYDETGNSPDAAILTIYNSHDNEFQKVHTLAVTKENGKFYTHNHGANSYKIAYDSITDIINKIISGNEKFMYLTAIYKKLIYYYNYQVEYNKK